MLERTLSSDDKDYVWRKMNIFTRWWPSGRNVIVCFDVYDGMRNRFPVPILESSEWLSHDPYWIHAQLLEELLEQHDTSVWSIRNLVRTAEMVRVGTATEFL